MPNANFNLTALSPFTYECKLCCRCCHNQHIRLNPYEVLRLARARGVTTGEIIASATVEYGTVLRFEQRGCVFLGDNGCEAHRGRPLACRLYPLARYVASDGRAVYSVLPGHPESAGVFGEPGAGDTVEQYIRQQGAEPYIRAANRYFELFDHLQSLLSKRVARDGALNEMAVDQSIYESIADVDAWLSLNGGRQDDAITDDLEELVEMHIESVARWAEGLFNA